MQIDVHDDKKIAAIWLSNAEKNDAALRKSLEPIYKKYHQQKYLVAVYESGTEDLYESTLALLKYNRKRSAEREIAAESVFFRKSLEIVR